MHLVLKIQSMKVKEYDYVWENYIISHITVIIGFKKEKVSARLHVVLFFMLGG